MRMGYDMYREVAENSTGEAYFRLNIWGMSTVRPLLGQFGIVRNADWPQPPDARDYGITEHFDEEDPNLTDEHRRYLADLQQWRDGHNGEAPGIPDYKLGSNDGWLVTPVEIRSGIGWADEHHPGWRGDLDNSDEGRLALEFAEWMEGSSDGFRVW